MVPARYLNPTGPQSRALWEAIIQAFDQDELDRLLQFRLEKRLALLASLSKPYGTVVFDVLNKARAQGWLVQFVAGALEWNPHPDLYRVAQDLGLTAASVDSTANLESIVNQKSRFLDIRPWLSRLGRIEAQVCRVETPKATGTGFLVSPDVVVTNYHVMKNVIDAPATASEVVLRFDYKVVQDGPTQEIVNTGRTYGLSDDWQIDHSPYSVIDTKPDPKPHPPSEEELDYAFVRVKGRPGELPPEGQNDAPARGWVSLFEAGEKVESGQIGFIVQHPRTAPLKLAFGTVTALNENGTRVRYDANTENGSSGSPVFDVNLDLVALHHAGDPDYSGLAKYNQGVPFSAIVALLEVRGKLGELGVHSKTSTGGTE